MSTEISANTTFMTTKKFVPRKINPETLNNFTLVTPKRRSNHSNSSSSRNRSSDSDQRQARYSQGYKSQRGSVTTTTVIGKKKVYSGSDWRKKSEMRDQPYTKMILMNLPQEIRSLCGLSLLFRAFEKVLGIKMLNSVDFLNLPQETKDLLGKHYTLAEYGAVVEFETARAAKTCCGLLRRQVAEQGFRACLIKPGAEQELDRQLTTLIAAKTKEIQNRAVIPQPLDTQTRVSTIFYNIDASQHARQTISHDSGHDLSCEMRRLSLFEGQSKDDGDSRNTSTTDDCNLKSSD